MPTTKQEMVTRITYTLVLEVSGGTSEENTKEIEESILSLETSNNRVQVEVHPHYYEDEHSELGY
jgi:hypothetical protein